MSKNRGLPITLLFAISCGQPNSTSDSGIPFDAGTVPDAGSSDGFDSGTDSGIQLGDAGPETDGGNLDSGIQDASVADSGSIDASVEGGTDAGVDAGFDAGFSPVTHVYVGSGNGKISHYVMSDAGQLLFQQDINGGSNPSYLAFHPSQQFLYAANEASNGEISAFSINDAGVLSFLNRTSASGNGPAHIAVDKTGKFVATANYGGGQVPVVALDGGFFNVRSDLKTPGTNPHLVAFSPNNQFVFVPCKGSDWVAQFRFDSNTGTLTANAPPTIATASGAGPRHMVISLDGTKAFLVNELNNTASSYSISNSGVMGLIDTKSTLPSGYMGNNTGAHIALHPNQTLLFTSNRGHNSIATFRIAANGILTLIGHTPTQGNTPRDFTLTPNGNVLLVANQNSGNVVSFSVNATTGTLTPLGFITTVNSPAFVGAIAW